MKKLLIAVAIVTAATAGVALYLYFTVPSRSARLQFPLTEAQRSLLAETPASSEVVALIPTAAALYAELLENPVTREPVLQWAQSQQLPRLRWILGGADLAAWHLGHRIGCAVRLDPPRALLAKAYLFFAADAATDARWDGPTLLLNAPAGERLGDGELDSLLALAIGLPPADALVFQKVESRGAFPPTGRPAATAVDIDRDEILLTSHAPLAWPPQMAPVVASFPRTALLSATFVDPPRVLGDLDRLLAGRVSSLLSFGGSIALYDVDVHKLLPRPLGVIVIPASQERREALASLVNSITPSFGAGAPNDASRRVGGVEVMTRHGLGYTIEYADTGTTLLLAFDKASLPLYLRETFDLSTWPATRWSARIDPQRLVPVLERMGDNPGFRFVTPRLARSAKDLRNWVAALSNAKAIEAADSDSARLEELHVRIISK